MLIECKECGKKVSPSAKTCPNCGIVKPVKITKLPIQEQLKYFFSLPLHVQFIEATKASIGIIIILVIAVAVLA